MKIEKELPDHIDTYTLPSCYASALINGDYSGLSDEDEKELNNWLENVQPGYCTGCSDSEWFVWGHDMNHSQGATVMEFYFDNRKN